MNLRSKEQGFDNLLSVTQNSESFKVVSEAMKGSLVEKRIIQ